MGRLVAVCTSERKGTPKEAAGTALLVEDHGIQGDAHAGPGRRMVSMLDSADIEWMRSRGIDSLEYGAFGENLVVTDVDLMALGLGSRIRVGGEAELVVTQRGKVCHTRCVIYEKAGDCIMPRRGIFARVARGGAIAAGDLVSVVRAVPAGALQAVVLTISDRGARGERVDTAGPAVAGLLRERLDAMIYAAEVIPDDRQGIEDRLEFHTDGPGIDLICAVGGTGFAPRDVTPEAVLAVVEKRTPGLDEAMRAASLLKTPHAMLSRGASGIRGRTLILSLPGSERAATENLMAIIEALPHGLGKLRGDDSDCGVPPANAVEPAP